MRYAFIKTLIEEATHDKRIILLTADLGFTVFEPFREKFPDRFINVGVAEQNMMSLATGLAMTGKVVFAYSIATFATMRAWEQIRNDIAHHRVAVTIVGTGAGLSYADASFTHHALEDIHLMRGIPGMTVLCPADPVETAWATRTAIKLAGPVYLRLGKKGEPLIYTKLPSLKLGKASFVQRGKDLGIIATGNLVAAALEAAKILQKRQIQASVVSMHTVKPIDRSLINSFAKKFSLLVTIEEHSIIGGLGSAVAEVLSLQPSRAKLLRLGVPDIFILTIGSQAHLRNQLGLSPEKIAKVIAKHLVH